MNKFVPFLFLLLALGLCLYPAPNFNSTIDIQANDTYFVFSNRFFFNGLALACATIGALYLLGNRLGISWGKFVPALHFAVTVILLVLVAFLAHRFYSMKPTELLTERGNANFAKLNTVLAVVILKFLLVQAIFLVAFVMKAIGRR